MKHLCKFLFVIMTLVIAVAAFAVFSSADAAVAKIGDVEYESFDAAWAAAGNEATITLLQDVTTGGLTPSGTAEAPKKITIDLNGNSMTGNGSIMFKPGNYCTLSIVGDGVIHGYNSSIFETSSSTEIYINVGDGVHTIYMDDTAATSPNLAFFKIRGGNLTIKKAIMEKIKGTNNFIYTNGGKDVVINITVENSSMTLYKAGGANPLIQVDSVTDSTNPDTVHVLLKNSHFEAKVSPSDMGTGSSSAQAGKNVMFQFGGGKNSSGTDNLYPAEGSTFEAIGCSFYYKWRCFVANRAAAMTSMPIECTNCIFRRGEGNILNNAGDGAIMRYAVLTLNNCMFDDVNMQNAEGEWAAMGGSVTFTGSIRAKHGIMKPVNSSRLIYGDTTYDQLTSCYVKSDKDGFHYYLLKASEVNMADYIAVTPISYNAFNTNGMWMKGDTTYKTYTSGTASISINAKLGNLQQNQLTTAEDSVKLGNMMTVTTENATNRYLRFFSEQDPKPYYQCLNASGAGQGKDAYLDFNLVGNATTYPFSQYNYFTFDMDVMTDTHYQNNMACNVIGRPVGGGSPAMNNNAVFSIATETSGAHAGETYFALGGNKLYVGKDAYTWHHITVILRVESADDKMETGECAMLLYVDGRFVAQTAPGANSSGVGYFNALRFTYGNNTTCAPNDAICFDNIKVATYAKVTAENYVDPIATLFNNHELTLPQAKYINFNDEYEYSEVAPITLVEGVYFQTLADGYEYAAPTRKDITLLRNTSEAVDVKANITVFTNGIDWVPTDDSWGFERQGEGSATKYVFSTALNRGATTYWHSNPFDSDYAFEYNVKGGRYVAHPIGDENYFAAENFIVKTENGGFVYKAFIGWSNEEGSTVADATFPVITSAELGNNYEYYAVYAESVPLYVVDPEQPASLALLTVNEDWEEVTVEYPVYAGGTDLETMRTALAALEGKHGVMLCDDIVTNRNSALFYFNSGTEIDFDLAGHSIVHVPNGKMRVMNVGEGGKLNVFSSQPGASILGRMVQPGTGYSNQATGLFTAASDATITVTGPNLTLRGGIILEVGESVDHFVFNISDCTFEQLVGDSKAIFIVRTAKNCEVNINNFRLVSVAYDWVGSDNANYPGTTEGAKDANGTVPNNNPGAAYPKPLLDIGGNSNEVEGIAVTITNSQIFYLQSATMSQWLVGRLPKNAVVTIENTVGSYTLGANTNVGGQIVAGTGNRYMATVNQNSANYSCVSFKDGVVEGRQWASTNQWVPSYTYHDAYHLSATYLDYLGEERTFTTSSSYKIRYGTYSAGEYRTVEWHINTDVESTLLWRENWANPEKSPFYSNSVPSNTDANGFTYVYPKDAWAMFAQIDGVDYYAPDPTKAMLTSVPYFKQNVVMYSDFGLNIFVPKSKAETTVKVGETLLPLSERTVDGADYYVATYKVGAGEAAEEITYEITFSGTGFSNTQTLKTSVAAYIQALSGFEGGAYADLAAAMLRYAKAAFLFGAEEGESLPAILEIGEPTAHAEGKEAVNTIAQNDVVKGAGIALGDKPVFVLALGELDGEHEIEIRYAGASGKVYVAKKTASAGDQAITLDGVKLFDLDETLTIKVDGEVIGQYNLAAYAQAQTDAKAQAVLVALVDYIAAAEAYLFN